MRRASRWLPAAMVLAVAAPTIGALVGTAYCMAKSLDSELLFLDPSRAPTIDETMISCPVEYALHSAEANDVVFVGGSSCRCGIDPALLPGLSSFNLGSIVG